MARGKRVGGLVAELMLQDKDFRNKLNRAGRLASRRTQEMRRAFNAVAKRMAQVGAVAAGVMAAGIGRAMQSIDALAKTSDKLGIPTEALQVLQEAARLSGVEVRSLEMGVQRMVRRVSEAAKGTGEAVDAIKELGLEARELNELSPDKQMEVLAGAMEDVEKQSDRVRLAMKLFDSEGVALVNTLAMGEGAFQEIRDEMERYGIAISRIDAAKIEQSTDSFTKLRRITKGFFEQMAIQVAPVLSEVGDRILDNADSMGGMGEVAEKVMNKMVSLAGKVGDVFHGWNLLLNATAIGLTAIGSQISRLADEFGVFDRIAEIQNAMGKAATEPDRRKAAEEQLVAEGKITPSGMLGIRLAGPGTGRTNEELERELRLIEQRTEKLAEMVPQSSALVNREALKQMERDLKATADELSSRMDDVLANGKPSDRIKGAVEEIQTDWEKMANDIAARREGMASGAVDIEAPITKLGEAATAAADALNGETEAINRRRQQGMQAGRRTHAEIMAQGGAGAGRRTHAEIMGQGRAAMERQAEERAEVQPDTESENKQQSAASFLEEIRDILAGLQEQLGTA